MCEFRDQIQKAANYLVADLRNPPSTEGICQATGLSEFKLKKGFREFLETTMGAYLRRARMEKAAQLLLQDQAITVISLAESVGFSNASRFAEAFRKHHGCNPSEYLKRHS